MSDAVVAVRGLEKTYKVHERETGVGATVRSFFKRRFKDVPAVGGIDFDIARGEVVGFLGPNGAGKSTTMRILTCFIAPSAGVAKVRGHDVFSKIRLRKPSTRPSQPAGITVVASNCSTIAGPGTIMPTPSRSRS